MSITNSKLAVTLNNDIIEPQCCCSASTISFAESLLLVTENCEGSTFVWQQYDGEVWNDLLEEGFFLDLFALASAGYFRAKLSIEGCCNVYTTPVFYSPPIT